jgi:hypothetical protein
MLMPVDPLLGSMLAAAGLVCSNSSTCSAGIK